MTYTVAERVGGPRTSMDVVDTHVHLNVKSDDHQSCVDQGIAVMDALGIAAMVVDDTTRDKPLLPDGVTRYPSAVGELAADRFPTRFAYVAKIDPRDPELDDLVGEVPTKPGCLGIRIYPGPDHFELLMTGKLDVLAAAQRHNVPVMISPRGRMTTMEPWVRQFADLQFIVDHAGLVYPPQKPVGPDSFGPLEDLIALAQYANVAVKWGHLPMISLESYPYRDLLPHLHRVLDAFGRERVMWESDWTYTASYYTYAEALLSVRFADELSESDKRWLLGKTARAVLRWPALSDAVQ